MVCGRTRIGSIVLFILAIAFLAQPALAFPTIQSSVNLTQPDGSILTAKVHGDEHFSTFSTLNGSLLKRREGWWLQADQNASTVVSAFYKGVTSFEEQPFPLLDMEASVSNEKVLVLLIQFPDKLAKTNPEEINNLLFNNSPEARSLHNYLDEVSNHKYHLQGTVIEKWYTSKHNMKYYGGDSTEKDTKCPPDTIDSANSCTYELVKEVIELAERDGVNFTQYAKDGTHLMIVHAGANQAKPPALYDPFHKDLLYTKWQILNEPLGFDTLSVRSYAIFSEEDGLAAYAHEFGHDLGLPELYDTDGSSDGIGLWGIMGLQDDIDDPVHPCAWAKVILGWVRPITITESGNYELIRGNVYKIPITDEEYFLLENRVKEGFDSDIPGPGLLIWHVDDSVVDEQYPLFLNSDENHRRVDLVEAHPGSQDLDLSKDLVNDQYFGDVPNIGEPLDAWYSSD